MAKAKMLGKEDLCKMDIKFIIANVPVFAIESHQSKLYRMSVELFDTEEQLKEVISKKTPIVLFDYPSVYKDDRYIRINGEVDKIAVRYCSISFNDLFKLKENVKESTDVNYTFKWDFSFFDKVTC